MSLNIRHLKYFVATAEIGQVSRAAVELSVSQSAVTAAIRELERTLGAALFIRSSRGMTLTPPGQQFLASSYEILAKVEDALNVQEGPAVDGRLKVAASYTVIGYFLPAHLERLAKEQPRLSLDLHETTREIVEEGLVRGRFDIGVALTSNIANPELASETLIRSPRRLWVAARHPLLERGQVTLADVANEDYVMLTIDEAAHTAMRYWSLTPFSPRVTLRTSSVEAVRSLVANRLGVTILSDMVYRPWSLEGRRLETVELAEDIPAMDVGLVWRKGIAFTPAMRAFRDYFRSRFRGPSAIGVATGGPMGGASR